jgi:hypothetical protein
MRFGLKKTSYSDHLIDPLDSKEKRHVASGVWIDSSKVDLADYGDGTQRKIVQAFMPLAKITATGKYCPLKASEVLTEAGAAVKATLATGVIGNNNALRFTAKTGGVAGNSITIAQVNPGTPSAALGVVVAGNAITANLATNAAAYATGATGVEGNNNGLTWTSKLVGTLGNDIVVVLEDPSAVGQALAISVKDHTIVAKLATDGAGAISTTGDLLKAAIAGNAGANALVGVADTGASDGSAAVTDEVVELAGGQALAITSTAAEVLAAINLSADAMLLLDPVTDDGASTGAAVVTAVAATPLAGGANDVVETCTIKDAQNFQVGDSVVIGSNGAKVLTAVNKTTKAITWVGGIAVVVGDTVKTADGSQTAVYLLAERIDLTDGDIKAGAIDMARVIEARMPFAFSAAAKTELKNITFV